MSLQTIYLEWLREVVPSHGGDELVLLLSKDGFDGRDANGHVSARHQQVGIEDGAPQGDAHALHQCTSCFWQHITAANWRRQRGT